MPDSRDYITHYVKYFNMKAPSSFAQAILLLLLGAATGIFSSLVIYQNLASNYASVIVSGFSTGVFVISLPALLTVVLIKTVKRRMLLKHAMLSTLLVTIVYSVLVFVNAVIFAETRNVAISYFLLILFNACIYGYWFLMDKVVMGRGKSAIPIAAVQPVLNTLFYLPLGRYILNINVPLGITLIKLSAGMLVFLAAGYVFLYIIDRPAKRMLKSSGINILETMLSQWLFNFTNDVKVIGYGAGIRRKLSMDVLMLKGKKGYKGIFVNPDIHFGPFQGVGGSVAPLLLGDLIVKKYDTVPFVLHGALDIQDNPIITSQVYTLARKIENTINGARGNDFARAYGNISVGKEGNCTVTNLAIGDSNLFLLSKAPYVTEDMSREVGEQLKHSVAGIGNGKVILIEAHNSRFESASADELAGIRKGNPYVRNYEKAMINSLDCGTLRSLSFGASCSKLAPLLQRPKDLGEGYASVCIFKFGRRKFCIVYFDANNMLPTLRNTLVRHIREKFKIDVEVCTTDTHSINTVSSSASNSLGSHTKTRDLIPVIDSMLQSALKEMEPVNYAYKRVEINNFPVWGEKADELIENTSKEVKHILKYVTPMLIVVAFLIAAWAIYVV